MHTRGGGKSSGDCEHAACAELCGVVSGYVNVISLWDSGYRLPATGCDLSRLGGWECGVLSRVE